MISEQEMEMRQLLIHKYGFPEKTFDAYDNNKEYELYDNLCVDELVNAYYDLCLRLQKFKNERIYYQYAYKVIDKIIPIHCPREGEFVGYKKAYDKIGNCVILKLRIPKDAKRSSGFDNKCRCSKAFVEDIYELGRDGIIKRGIDIVYSSYDRNFKYRLGEYVEEPNYDENRFNECSHGIHFFMSEEEAKAYLLYFKQSLNRLPFMFGSFIIDELEGTN